MLRQDDRVCDVVQVSSQSSTCSVRSTIWGCAQAQSHKAGLHGVDKVPGSLSQSFLRLRFPVVQIVPDNYLYARVALVVKDKGTLNEGKLSELTDVLADEAKAQEVRRPWWWWV